MTKFDRIAISGAPSWARPAGTTSVSTSKPQLRQYPLMRRGGEGPAGPAGATTADAWLFTDKCRVAAGLQLWPPSVPSWAPLMPPDDSTIPVILPDDLPLGAGGAGGPDLPAPNPTKSRTGRPRDNRRIAGADHQLCRAAHADNTRRAYRAAVARFCACGVLVTVVQKVTVAGPLKLLGFSRRPGLSG